MRRHFFIPPDTIEGPKKTVTIRDVNQSLYELFVSLANRLSTNIGTIFTRLIEGYDKMFHPLMIGPGPMRMRKMDFSIEVIDNLDELIISREDLLALGEDTRLILSHVNRLVFDETVDNQLLLKYVLRIRKSQVETKGSISKLFLKSINQERIAKDYFYNLQEETTNVTIRNVGAEIYDHFVAQCQSNKIRVGEAVNDLLRRTIPHLEIHQILMYDPKLSDINTILLSMHPSVTVNNQDLQDLADRKVLFHRIGELTFGEDIDPSLFKNHVMGIYNCKQVNLPNTIPKLLQFSRVKEYP